VKRKLSSRNMAPANLCWSPDGKSVAFSADVSCRRSQRRRLYPNKALHLDNLLVATGMNGGGTRSHLHDVFDGGEPKDSPLDHDYPTWRWADISTSPLLPMERALPLSLI
jgi:hypothetical protein